MSTNAKRPRPEERDERVSIPLDFDQALIGLLQTDPADDEDKGEEKPK